MYYTTKISKFRHLAKRKAPWSESRGPDRFRSQSRRLWLTATGLGGGLFHELDAGSLGVGFGDYFEINYFPMQEIGKVYNLL